MLSGFWSKLVGLISEYITYSEVRVSFHISIIIHKNYNNTRAQKYTNTHSRVAADNIHTMLYYYILLYYSHRIELLPENAIVHPIRL